MSRVTFIVLGSVLRDEPGWAGALPSLPRSVNSGLRASGTWPDSRKENITRPRLRPLSRPIRVSVPVLPWSAGPRGSYDVNPSR